MALAVTGKPEVVPPFPEITPPHPESRMLRHRSTLNALGTKLAVPLDVPNLVENKV